MSFHHMLGRVWRGVTRRSVVGASLLVSACSNPGPSAPVVTAVQRPTASAVREERQEELARAEEAKAPSARAKAKVPDPVKLGAPGVVRNWNEVRMQAAHRLVESHPNGSYVTPSPDPLLAIPVIEVELNANGSVRRVTVLRYPRQAKDTTQIAIDAIHHAAPYGDVSRLPRPWRFTETFLFDDDRRFKPRSLD
jgi:hypothetical protein